MAEEQHGGSKDKNPAQQQTDDAIAQAIIDLKYTLKKEADINRHQEGREDKGNKKIGVVTLGFVILTTGGIFYQAYILRSSDEAFKKTANIAADTEHRQLRAYAYVSIKKGKDGIKFEPTKTVDLQATINVYGQTPAYEVAVKTGGGPANIKDFTSSGGVRSRGNSDPQYGRATIIAPGIDKEITLPFPKYRKLTEAEVNNIGGPDERYFVFGIACYRDVFICWHYVKWCYMIGGPNNDVIECPVQDGGQAVDADDPPVCRHAKEPECNDTAK